MQAILLLINLLPSQSLDPLGGSMSGFYTSSELDELYNSLHSGQLNITVSVLSSLSYLEIPIPYISVSSSEGLVSQEKTSILISAGLSAGNPIGTSGVLLALNALLQNPMTAANLDAYFVPVVNIDAYQEMEKQYQIDKSFKSILKNKRSPTCPDVSKSGVNLARNFDVNWGKTSVGSSADGCDDFYRGGKAFSEPEIQGLVDLVDRIQPTTWLHFDRDGDAIVIPDAIRSNPDKKAKFFYDKILDYPLEVGTSEELFGKTEDGNLLDYAMQDGIYAVEVGLDTDDLTGLNKVEDLIRIFYENTNYRVVLRGEGVSEYKCEGIKYLCKQKESDSYAVFTYTIENKSPIDSPLIQAMFDFAVESNTQFKFSLEDAFLFVGKRYNFNPEWVKESDSKGYINLIAEGSYKTIVNMVIERSLNGSNLTIETTGNLAIYPKSLPTDPGMFYQEKSRSYNFTEEIKSWREEKAKAHGDLYLFLIGGMVSLATFILAIVAILLCLCKTKPSLLDIPIDWNSKNEELK